MSSSQPHLRYALPLSDRLLIALAVFLVPTLYTVLVVLALSTLATAAGMFAGIAYLVREHPALARWAPALGVSALAVLMAALGVVRAIFIAWRAPDHFEPAVWINTQRESALMALIEELCGKLGTRPPDAVIMHTEPIFAVMQGRLTVLNANPRGRILIVGLPLLGCLKVSELRAILAHEFAHFTGIDILYGSVVSRVRRSLMEAIQALHITIQRQRGLAYLVSAIPLRLPSLVMWMFAIAFIRLDLRVTRGRELRADALSAQTCGARSFENALKKTAAYGGVFYSRIVGIAHDVARSQTPDESSLRMFRKRMKDFEPDARMALNTMLEMQDGKWDSHPSLQTRLQRLPQIDEQYPDDGPALGVIQELKTYEKKTGNFIANEYQIRRRAELGRPF